MILVGMMEKPGRPGDCVVVVGKAMEKQAKPVDFVIFGGMRRPGRSEDCVVIIGTMEKPWRPGDCQDWR